MDIQIYKIIKANSGQKLKKWKISSKEETHEKDLLHLSTHLLVVNNKREVLCRKRAKNDFRYPNLWTTTIGTHVLLGQDDKQILEKYFPLKTDFKRIGEFRVHDDFENEINFLYFVHANEKMLDKDFMKDRKFIGYKELENLIDEKKTTPHLTEAFLFLKNSIHIV